MNYNSVSDDTNSNIQSIILDPLSVIIKLAIINNKPIGTKLAISQNIIYLQEPGPFQGISRYIFKNNKTDIQYLYNPIELACKTYLNEEKLKSYPKIKDLFKHAQYGLYKLIDTYKNSSIMRISLHYYLSLISNHLDKKNDDSLFKKDAITSIYTNEILDNFNKIWTSDKIKIVLNICNFLSQDDYASENVKSLETIMAGIDKSISQCL